MKTKPPIGLRPPYIWRAARRREIVEAIARYTEANKAIPKLWLDELAQLSAQDAEK